MASLTESQKRYLREKSESMKHVACGKFNFRDGRLTIDVDPDLTAYYRWLLSGRYPLLKPSWGSHITVAVDVDAAHYHGQTICYEYSHMIRISGDTTGDRHPRFYFLDVWCPELETIRSKLGLETWYKFHMTIGRTYE